MSDILKVSIYENQFSDFLIIYDEEKEIKALTSEEWGKVVKDKSIAGVSSERVQFSLLKGIPFDM